MTATGPPAVTGLPLRLLRVEGLVILAASLAAYAVATEEPWWLAPALLLVPDVSALGYLRSHRTGALTYDLAHSYPAPALLGAWAVIADEHLVLAVALVWFAHIGMDRALGYGLKYDTSFTDTHLGRIGRAASRSPEGVGVDWSRDR